MKLSLLQQTFYNTQTHLKLFVQNQQSLMLVQTLVSLFVMMTITKHLLLLVRVLMVNGQQELQELGVTQSVLKSVQQQLDTNKS